MITIKKYYIQTVPRDIYMRMYRANFGSGGMLRDQLVQMNKEKVKYNKENHRIFVAFKDGIFAGWGVTYPYANNRETGGFGYMCYVMQKYRKQGIGTRLLRNAAYYISSIEKRFTIKIYPHDSRAQALYKHKDDDYAFLAVDDIIPTKIIKNKILRKNGHR